MSKYTKPNSEAGRLVDKMHLLASQVHTQFEKLVTLSDDQKSMMHGHMSQIITMNADAHKAIEKAKADDVWADLPSGRRLACELAAAVISYAHEVCKSIYTFETRITFKPQMVFIESGVERVTEEIIG